MPSSISTWGAPIRRKCSQTPWAAPIQSRGSLLFGSHNAFLSEGEARAAVVWDFPGNPKMLWFRRLRRPARTAKLQHLGRRSMARQSHSLVILASEVCSDYLCDFASTGFVLDPAGDPAPGGAYCERCGRKMVAEYCEKIEPGWKFQPGKIYGDLAERPPAAPEPPKPSPGELAKDDCSFVSYVVDRLTS